MFPVCSLLWRAFPNSRRFYGCEAFQKYKHSCTHLNSLPRKEVRTFFTNLETILCDADGVLWLHDNPINGSVDIFNHLRQSGKRTFIVTNNSTRTRESLADKACSMAIEISCEQIICTSSATVEYLKAQQFQKRAYIIGSNGLVKEFNNCSLKYSKDSIGLDPKQGTMKTLREKINLEKDIGAVVVAFDKDFSYSKMVKACAYLQDPQCMFIVTNRDEQIPTPTITLPGTGCLSAAIEMGSQRQPMVIGKPNKEFSRPLIEKGWLKPAKTLMIGDRGSTDMLFAYNCGLYSLLVGTGTDSLVDVKKWQTSNNCELRKMIPDFYLPQLGDLWKILCDEN